MGTVHQYCIAENLSNLAIWRSGEKFPNEIPQISTPSDSGRKAHHSSTYNYVLHQYFKIAVYSCRGMLLGWKHTVDNRPYKLSLTYKYKYTLERAREGSAPTINGPAKQGLLSA